MVAATQGLVMGIATLRNGDGRDSWVVFDHVQGSEIGKLLRFTRHLAVFEIHAPSSALQMSQVLSNFRILLHEQTIYSGRAVIRSLIHAGVAFVCEVLLDDEWVEPTTVPTVAVPRDFRVAFEAFVQGWQRVYKVYPEFKVVVADLHSFLSDLRLWLDHQELAVGKGSTGDPTAAALEAVQRFEEPVVQAINLLHERFEEIGDGVANELRPAHQHFARRHLHPLFLCSPFGHRAYQKPLGYAGDYEMVNMILRSPYEGASLFAIVMNVWLLRHYPSEAHRNRIEYLVGLLVQEALRCKARGEPLRALSIGCGPAHEIQRVLESSPIADDMRVTLIDMNDETLSHVNATLEALKRRHGRRASITTRKRSVFGLLKDAARLQGSSSAEEYDFVYCAGLFDYLTDAACRQLLKVASDWLAPGGLLVATNVVTYRPFRHMLEFVLDWHLNYRTGEELKKLVPPEIAATEVSVRSDPTGVNLFLEIRRSPTA